MSLFDWNCCCCLLMLCLAEQGRKFNGSRQAIAVLTPTLMTASYTVCSPAMETLEIVEEIKKLARTSTI